MYQHFFKRVMDLIIIIPLLIPILILYCLIAIFIKIDSKGPVIFKQSRLGKDGNEFKILKFRTMIDNAEKIGTGINTYQDDPRITKVGNFLRKTSLDEIPQLFNVLKGDMSIVGPRPPVPYHPREYKEYSKFQIQRFNVKPGITGLAQVKGRNHLTWDERIVYDVEYVNELSLSLDIKIIVLTFIKVFTKEGIHSEKNN